MSEEETQILIHDFAAIEERRRGDGITAASREQTEATYMSADYASHVCAQPGHAVSEMAAGRCAQSPHHTLEPG